MAYKALLSASTLISAAAVLGGLVVAAPSAVAAPVASPNRGRAVAVQTTSTVRIVTIRGKAGVVGRGRVAARAAKTYSGASTTTANVVGGKIVGSLTFANRCGPMRVRLTQAGVQVASSSGSSPIRSKALVAGGRLSVHILGRGCRTPYILRLVNKVAPRVSRATLTTPVGVLSGAAGDGVASGSFGAWRGAPVTIAGTWNDGFEAQTQQWSIQRGAEYGSWDRDIDVAVGAIFKDRGETWAAAATGAYDARWRIALTSMKTAWGSRTGTMHIRFAHEFNGDWVPWPVTGSAAPQFVATWKRFRALQREILPVHKLVFCPNDGTAGSLGLDWRAAFPGASYVDEMAVDSYNQYPYVATATQFGIKINQLDSRGAPLGIEKHRQFAASVGLPMAVAEWSSNASMGDSAVFVGQFHSWVSAHAGTGAGQVPYEILFNIGSFGSGQFQLYPASQQPSAAAAYARIF